MTAVESGDECRWCGEPLDQPCVSWNGQVMHLRHAEVFGATSAHAPRPAPSGPSRLLHSTAEPAPKCKGEAR